MIVEWLVLAKWQAITLTGLPVLISMFLIHVQSTVSSAFPKDGEEKVPYFNQRPNNVSFYEGDTAILQCSVSNIAARYVVWRRTAEPHPISFGEYVYSPDERYNVSRNAKFHEWNLIIRQVQLSDAGVYECAVASKKRILRHVLLRVQETPTTVTPIVTLAGTKFVMLGETIYLWCNVTGTYMAPEDLDWFQNGNKLNPSADDNIEIHTKQSIEHRTILGSFELRHSKLKDAGIYVCRSTDLILASFHVYVLDEGMTPRSGKNKRRTTGGKNRSCSIVSSDFTNYIVLLLTVYQFYEILATT